MNTFKAVHLIKADDDHEITTSVLPSTESDLSPGDVMVRVAYSSLNFKDALASQPKTGVIKQYPLIAGIDFSGTVISSTNPNFKKGDSVIATGYDIGVSHSGGLSEIARVPGEWLVPLPHSLTLKESMIIGTAGYTAALAIDALEAHGLTPSQTVLITGATGGVGSLALAMLKAKGYQHLTAVSRKTNDDARSYLSQQGASTIITPNDLTEDKVRPLMKQEYDAVIDTVGGPLLTAILPRVRYGGSLALCGNAGGIQLTTTVLPFILRHVQLLGIDSVHTPYDKRQHIWQRLATDLKPAQLERAVQATISLEEVPRAMNDLLNGQMTGRYLVTLNP